MRRKIRVLASFPFLFLSVAYSSLQDVIWHVRGFYCDHHPQIRIVSAYSTIKTLQTRPISKSIQRLLLPSLFSYTPDSGLRSKKSHETVGVDPDTNDAPSCTPPTLNSTRSLTLAFSSPQIQLRHKFNDIESAEADEDPKLNQLISQAVSTPLPQARNDVWLQEATESFLDPELYPIGELTSEDVESIGSLMGAWVHRESLDAAISVEKLLKRVVDDLRVHNSHCQVNTQLYIHAIEAWARSGVQGAASRAQLIHDQLIYNYQMTNDSSIAPSLHSYNVLLSAWSKSAANDAHTQAEYILSEMLRAVNDDGVVELKPDAVTFSTVIDIYSRSTNTSAIERCEELFQLMNEINVSRNAYTFCALQNVYARSGALDAPIKSKAILDQMLDLYSQGDVLARPNVLNFNSVLHSLSRTCELTESAIMANKLLRRMELSPVEGGYEVEPDRLTYALTILTCARCRNTTLGTRLAEENLFRMEARARLEEQHRATVSSVAPPAVTLDVECFNVVLRAISQSRASDAVDKIRVVIKRMQRYAQEGKECLTPNLRSWNALLNAISRAPYTSGVVNVAEQAEQVLETMFELPKIKPNAFTFASVLSCYQRCSPPECLRADALVERMHELYKLGRIDRLPDVYHMTILCSTWAKSHHPRAPERCLSILNYMIERHKTGIVSMKPNVRTYNAVLDCLSRSSHGDHAEQILHDMLNSFASGDMDSKPDNFSFNSVLNAFCRSKKKDSGKRAEIALERFLEFHEENHNVCPDTRSFMQLISYYGRSRDLDAPYRAEHMLNRMVALYRDGMRSVEPNVVAFTTVIDSYAYARHSDAGRKGEQMLKLMKQLVHDFPLVQLPVTTAVMNSLLFAWASCGNDDSGCYAERILDEMERQCVKGAVQMCPDTRSYMLVLTAWTKSNCLDKAERALGILRRMEFQTSIDNKQVCVEEHAYALVINACAFSNASGDSERQAFRIAVMIFDEMLASSSMHPEPLTYGWFLQACGRLRVPIEDKEPHIQRAFSKCCENGLVTDFVLHRLRGAASDAMFEILVISSIEKEREAKTSVTIWDLPSSWYRNSIKRRDKG